MSGSSGIARDCKSSKRLRAQAVRGFGGFGVRALELALSCVCALQVMGTLNLPRRWLAFNGVGLLGVGVQLALVALLVHGLGLHYLARDGNCSRGDGAAQFRLAPALDVARPAERASARDAAGRLVRFHLLNGAVSLAGNLAIVAVLGG